MSCIGGCGDCDGSDVADIVVSRCVGLCSIEVVVVVVGVAVLPVVVVLVVVRI